MHKAFRGCFLFGKLCADWKQRIDEEHRTERKKSLSEEGIVSSKKRNIDFCCQIVYNDSITVFIMQNGQNFAHFRKNRCF